MVDEIWPIGNQAAAGGIKAGVNERPSREAPMAQETVVRHKRGGIYFDDFVVGHLYEHPLTRTVTQMDNMLFSNMTLNPNRSTSTGNEGL
jgi:hypothetical protein